MKEKKFDENIEKIYSTLSGEQKAEYTQKEDKMNKSFFIVGIVLAIIVVGIAIGVSVWLIVAGETSTLPLILVIFAAFLIASICTIYSSKKALNATDEVKIKTHIDRLEKQKQIKQQTEHNQRLKQDVNYRLQTEKIKSVTILDSYTEISDKLHAVLNYQEIIQARVYKFNVSYNDGSSKVITAPENSEEYAVLMPFVGKGNNKQANLSSEKSNIEKLREYKQLLDDGIITQEEFEAKKKELL